MTLVNNPFERIGSGAKAYADVRPSYPQQLIDSLELNPEKKVLDIGAGTGKLTAQLVRAGAQVFALEPAADFRETFLQALPEFPVERLLSTTAEATSLPAHSFDLLTYGQCWHWLDPEAASAEAQRILRPQGEVAIFFNQFRVEIPWVLQLSRIMRSGDVHRFDKPPKLSAAFSEPELTHLQWEQPLTVQELFELGTTRSSWIKSTPENRARMRENLRWYLEEELGYGTHDIVMLPYHTYLWRSICVASS